VGTPTVPGWPGQMSRLQHPCPPFFPSAPDVFSSNGYGALFFLQPILIPSPWKKQNPRLTVRSREKVRFAILWVPPSQLKICFPALCPPVTHHLVPLGSIVNFLASSSLPHDKLRRRTPGFTPFQSGPFAPSLQRQTILPRIRFVIPEARQFPSHQRRLLSQPEAVLLCFLSRLTLSPLDACLSTP